MKSRSSGYHPRPDTTAAAGLIPMATALDPPRKQVNAVFRRPRRRPSNGLVRLSIASIHFLVLAIFVVEMRGPESLSAHSGSPAVYSAVWKVYNSTYSGTAFAIESSNYNRFMTNAHVIHGLVGGKPISLSQEGNRYSLRFHRLVAISTTYDLAIFETKESINSNYLKFADSLEKEETGLYAVGYPQRTFGVVEQTDKIAFGDSFSYEFAGNSVGHPEKGHRGFSGGPILNGRDEVVMVAFGFNSNLIGGVKGEVAKRLMAGDSKTGVACRPTETPSQCRKRAITQTAELGWQGHLAALYQLGIDGDLAGDQAPGWLVKAAQTGSTRAQQRLALVHAEKGDAAKAFHWDQRSKTPVSVYGLGIYYSDQGNYEKAFPLILASAKQGYAIAQYAVGLMLYHGVGTAPDRDRSKAWLEKAAAKSHIEAAGFLRGHF